MKRTGAEIVLKALEAPMRPDATNAGLEGSVIVNKVKELSSGIGFNALTEEYVEMSRCWYIGPYKSYKIALQNATSVASTFLNIRKLL